LNAYLRYGLKNQKISERSGHSPREKPG
jgi:hypothetical protein